MYLVCYNTSDNTPHPPRQFSEPIFSTTFKGGGDITGAIAIVIRTHDGPKNPYIPLFLHAILGPEYYVPPK